MLSYTLPENFLSSLLLHPHPSPLRAQSAEPGLAGRTKKKGIGTEPTPFVALWLR